MTEEPEARERKRPIAELFDRALDSAQGGRVSIGTVVDCFGTRSFGPLIAILAIIAIFPPFSGIPGVPITIGCIVMLLAGQIVVGREHPWLPKFVRRIGIARQRFADARERARKTLDRMDALIAPRIGWAAAAPAQWAAALCIVVLAASLIPLDFIPFVAALPASAILLFGLGLFARDGLLMLLGFAATGGAFYILVAHILLPVSGG